MSRIDPRLAAVGRRLADVRRTIAVTGGKGGIGKSLIASSLALTFADRGSRVGLFDLDLTGPCDHLILGVGDRFPTEEFGVEPPLVAGVRFMSIAYFNGDRPAPLRGRDVTNALVELLAISNWGALDLLVIDMPPGLGDATLDSVRLLSGAEYLVVTTPSRIVRQTVARTLEFHCARGSSIVGVVENMAGSDPTPSAELARRYAVPFLGSLPHDPAVESALGSADRLRATGLARAMAELADKIERG